MSNSPSPVPSVIYPTSKTYLNLHKYQNPPNTSLTPGSCMWNPKPQPLQADDGSPEVTAIAEDTGNVMGTTWPPMSYTCMFCPREFRSAQALGGHMNVHRRERDRLHQMQPATAALMNNPTSSILSSTPSTFLFPTQQLSGNGGSCPLPLYQSPNPNGFACSVDSPPTLLTISPYPSVNSMAAATTPAAPLIIFPVTLPGSSNSPSTMSENHNLNDGNNTSGANFKETSIEELDLELRLGHPPATS
ncbi:hypothetical protein V6N13_076877 [Hibiscus sabdariffa]|uniref:C2H2-type domain-containing protein n=1 Tax=Hibiscus sabdariffa TaxID=183260 RepID=A0ABR2CM56_9ROSI